MNSQATKIESLEKSIKSLTNCYDPNQNLYKARLIKRFENRNSSSVIFRKSKYAIGTIAGFFTLLPLILILYELILNNHKRNLIGGLFLGIFGFIVVLSISRRRYLKNILKITSQAIEYNDEIIPLELVLIAFVHMEVSLFRDSRYFLYLGLENLEIKVYEVSGLSEDGKGFSVVPDNREILGHWIEYFKCKNRNGLKV